MRKHHSCIRKEIIVNSIFILCFLVILVVPLAKMNRASNQVSEIDNRILAERPPLKMDAGFTTGIEAYLLDRIGFRTRMIHAYQKICDVLFKKLVHPIYMYGEEGYIFFKGGYIDDYQHLNINKAYIENCGVYLEKIYQYLSDRNIKFIYFLAPDKKSVYSEFFPPTINVFGDKSQATLLIDELKRRNIPFIHPIQEFKEAKKYQQIYNKKYDAGHWNEYGAFIGHSMITRKLKEYFSYVKLLSTTDYTIAMKSVTSLHVSHFEINEEVPYYTLKSSKPKSVSQNTGFKKKRILIFHDSYFSSIRKFYSGNFSEINSTNMNNIDTLEALVSQHKPDVVLIENAERTISAWYNKVL